MFRCSHGRNERCVCTTDRENRQTGCVTYFERTRISGKIKPTELKLQPAFYKFKFKLEFLKSQKINATISTANMFEFNFRWIFGNNIPVFGDFLKRSVFVRKLN